MSVDDTAQRHEREQPKRRYVALLAPLATASALALAACGGLSPQEKAVKSALTAFDHAVAGGDYGKACSLLAPSTRRLVQQLGRQYGSKGANCPATLRKTIESLPAARQQQTRSAYRQGDIADISITGNMAKAKFTAQVNGKKTSSTATLLKHGNGWQVRTPPSVR